MIRLSIIQKKEQYLHTCLFDKSFTSPTDTLSDIIEIYPQNKLKLLYWVFHELSHLFNHKGSNSKKTSNMVENEIISDIAAHLMTYIFIQHYKKINPSEGIALEILWHIDSASTHDVIRMSAYGALYNYLRHADKPVDLKRLYLEITYKKDHEILQSALVEYLEEQDKESKDRKNEMIKEYLKSKIEEVEESLRKLKEIKKISDSKKRELEIFWHMRIYQQELLLSSIWLEDVTGISMWQVLDGLSEN